MTPKQQRIAIAEECGWKWIQTNSVAFSGLIGTDSSHSGNIRYQGTNDPSNDHLPTYGKAIPDYLTDLNAMHEAEKVLTEGQIYSYTGNLCKLMPHTKIFPSVHVSWTETVRATAAQRAEAFLRTIGKWITNPNEL